MLCKHFKNGSCTHKDIVGHGHDARCLALISDNTIAPSKCLVFERPDCEKQRDMVDKPEHYTRYGIETIDALRGTMSPDEFNGFLKGNAFKYLTRAGAKDSLEQDLHKVLWYAMFLYLSNGGSVESLKKTYDYMKVRFVTV